MKILATDGIAPSAKAALEALGCAVLTDFYEPEELARQVQNADCLIVRSATKVREPIIDAACETGRLKLVVRAGVGIDNIDHQYAAQKGITVKNTPIANTNAMAELALGQMFAVSRFIGIANVEMRQGKWNKDAYKGVELSGKKLALVGFGRTARHLAQKAQALGMEVAYYDLLGADAEAGFPYKPLAELITDADFISLHTPKTTDGKPIFTATEIATMKPGVRLINCARGGLIDEADLLAALDSGHVAAAGLDVFVGEPTPNPALLNHPNVSVTPHIGAQTIEAQIRIGEEVVETVKAFFNL